MGADLEFEESNDYLKIQLLRARAVSSGRVPEWRAVRDACNANLQVYQYKWLLAWWWVQANVEIEGFQGLADGADLLASLCSKWEFAGYDFYEWLSAKLREMILSVPLSADGPYTYTTVLNARFDPERAAAAENAVRASDRIEADLKQLKALNAALNRLYLAIDHTGPSYRGLVRLLVQIMAYIAKPTEGATARDRQANGSLSDCRVESIAMANYDGAESESAEAPRSPSAHAATPDDSTDVFLQIDGFEGTSTMVNHWGWIELQSYRHNMQSSSPSVVVKKLLDAASTKLYGACCTGRTFPCVTIDFCRRPGDSLRILRVELRDAAISSITQETGPDFTFPIEEITFRYRAVEWTYTRFGVDQVPEGVVATSSRVLQV